MRAHSPTKLIILMALMHLAMVAVQPLALWGQTSAGDESQPHRIFLPAISNGEPSDPSTQQGQLAGRFTILWGKTPDGFRAEQTIITTDQGELIVVDVSELNVDRLEFYDKRVTVIGRWQDGLIARLDGNGNARALQADSIMLESDNEAEEIDVEAAAGALGLPAGFVLETVTSGLNLGIAFDVADDGRIFIAEKAGVVRVFQNGVLRPTPFIDISGQVNSVFDRGLRGLAVHPAFPNQPYVYLFFTYDPLEVNAQTGNAGPDGAGGRLSRLIRVTADASQNYHMALAGSELVLLGTNSIYANIANPEARNNSVQSCQSNGNFIRDCLPADDQSHVGGALRFGKDGSLFVAYGDAANHREVVDYATHAQRIDSLTGKILRIHPDTGNGYPDNPFYDGNLRSNRSKVYSYGLRNPFRFAIQPTTGEVLIGDVGWNTWDELNSGRGANFGWPCYEGANNSVNLRQDSYASFQICQLLYAESNTVTPAMYAYNHYNFSSSVIAGDFYRGNSYPARYRNGFFYADYNRGVLEYLTFNAAGTVTAATPFARNLKGIVQISTGPGNDLYLMNIYTGALQRLRFTGAGNHPPLAQASANPSGGAVPLAVNFSSAGSTDPDGGTLTYRWEFGDGATATAPNPTHTYTAPGVYDAVLTVTDPESATASATVSIAAGANRPVATILSPAEGATYNVDDRINFRGAGVDAEDGDLSGASLTWALQLHHNDHTHFDSLPPTTGETGSFVVPDHGDNTWLELCLTATDNTNQRDTKCITLNPNTVRYTFDTIPTGLQLVYEGVSRATPFTVRTIVNAQQLLIAPPSQAGYSFLNWSDGGASTHTIRIGSSPQTVVAAYGNAGTGQILREWWTGIRGNSVISLTRNANYPNQPSGQNLLSSFAAPANFANNYGTRVRGYLHPPVSGDYRFWIASDNNSELWLSTNDNLANTTLIASVSGWTNANQWDKYGQQQSALIPLQAGQRYYIEALHKESSNYDHLAVAWQPPEGTRVIIDGQFLSPYVAPPASNGVSYAYYEGTWTSLPDFSALVADKTGVLDNFSLIPRSRNNNFAFRFYGCIDIPTNGDYTFFTKSDAGSQLYIDGALVVDNDGVHDSRERSGVRSLSAGRHALVVTFFETTLTEFLEVRYKGPGISKRLIPDSALFRAGCSVP